MIIEKDRLIKKIKKARETLKKLEKELLIVEKSTKEFIREQYLAYWNNNDKYLNLALEKDNSGGFLVLARSELNLNDSGSGYIMHCSNFNEVLSKLNTYNHFFNPLVLDLTENKVVRLARKTIYTHNDVALSNN